MASDTLLSLMLDRALTPTERQQLFRKHPKPKGMHAAPAGSGPARETCGSCAHLVRKRMATKTYLKCGLCRSSWTGGAGTDVKARDPACSKWQAASLPVVEVGG